jgi:hypothetical protein
VKLVVPSRGNQRVIKDVKHKKQIDLAFEQTHARPPLDESLGFFYSGFAEHLP